MKNKFFFPLLIVIASSSYGILSTIVKVAIGNGFTSQEAITSQYVIGFLLALLLCLITERKIPTLTKSGFMTLVFTGITTGTTGIVYGLSLSYLPASLAVVMLFQFTWIGLLIECIIHKRLPNRPEVISLLFLFAGTIFAAGIIDVDLSNIAWQGWGWGLLSAVSFAVFIQINSRQVQGITTITRTAIVSFFALVIVSIFLTPEIIWNGKLLNEGLWTYGLALGIFGITLPIVLLSIAVPKVGGGLSSILSAMELPVAIIASVLVLHEKVTALQLFGIVLVLVGMILPTVLAQRKVRA